jgi:hypothetical protein
MDTLVLVVVAVVSLITGAVAGLKVLAPRTKTKVDDKALEYAQLAEPVAKRVAELLGVKVDAQK